MVELARTEDFAAIADLNVRAYSEFAERLSPGSWEAMQQNLRSIATRAERATFMVVRSGRGLAGSVGYCPPGKSDPSVFAPDMASIILLAVDPAQRRNGIATALLLECIAKAMADRAPSVGLSTSEAMQAAQRLYGAVGFRRDRELPVRYGLRYFRFVLDLSSPARA